MTIMTQRYKHDDYYDGEKSLSKMIACNQTYDIIACTIYKEKRDQLTVDTKKENSLIHTLILIKTTSKIENICYKLLQTNRTHFINSL